LGAPVNLHGVLYMVRTGACAQVSCAPWPDLDEIWFSTSDPYPTDRLGGGGCDLHSRAPVQRGLAFCLSFSL